MPVRSWQLAAWAARQVAPGPGELERLGAHFVRALHVGQSQEHA